MRGSRGGEEESALGEGVCDIFLGAGVAACKQLFTVRGVFTTEYSKEKQCTVESSITFIFNMDNRRAEEQLH